MHACVSECLPLPVCLLPLSPPAHWSHILSRSLCLSFFPSLPDVSSVSLPLWMNQSISICVCVSVFSTCLVLSLSLVSLLASCLYLPVCLSLFLSISSSSVNRSFPLPLSLVLNIPFSPFSVCSSYPFPLSLLLSCYSLCLFLPTSLFQFVSLPVTLTAVRSVWQSFCLCPSLGILLPFPPYPQIFLLSKLYLLKHIHSLNFHFHADFQFSLEPDLPLTLNFGVLINSSYRLHFNLCQNLYFIKNYWVNK